MLIKAAPLDAVVKPEAALLGGEAAPLEGKQQPAINMTQLLRAKGNMEEAYKRRLRAELAKQNGLRLEIAQLVRTNANMEDYYRKRLRVECEALGGLQKELKLVASMWSE